MEFNPKDFEEKWQKRWSEDRIYEAETDSKKKSRLVADMFPYPSGSSMHVGHPRGYVATDVYSRLKRMQGFNVLHPMGWDAFGLPAEETAIENKEYPAATVARNITKFKAQLIMLGLGYDWSREINTTDPGYYKHTQRIFLELFKRGLARNDVTTVNWCPDLGTVLANEDIVDGKSERGGYPVYQQPMRQWILAITAYADRLIDDLELLPRWPEKVRNAQRNWIGRSEGHSFSFATEANVPIEVFTTRIDTLMGATFLVVAPEHAKLEELLANVKNADVVRAYVAKSKERTELDRNTTTEKTGVIIDGVSALHPVSGERLPIVVADYVLASYGTGAIMAVPGHDERDAEMAKVLSLPIVTVVENDVLVASGEWTGLNTEEARERIADKIGAKSERRFKIRDWVFSRQRFWGEPFPIVWVTGREQYDLIANGPTKRWLPEHPVHYVDEKGEHFAVPIAPEHLDAMRLPVVESYQPTGTLEGPLAGIDAWVTAYLDPVSGALFNENMDGRILVRRETNTMPQWAGSSWYWLRYMDPHNADVPFSKEAAAYWGPVNVYSGADHAVAHLIYARFWHKVLFDAGFVDFPEPFERLEFLGHILASDGSKISKRKGNSRSPEDVVTQVGADAFRLFEMFIGPFEKPAPWSDDGLIGTRRFLERVWRMAQKALAENAPESDPEVRSVLERTIQKVGEDIEAFKFNTAVSAMMVCVNELSARTLSVNDLKRFLAILAPFAPHATEELWHQSGETTSIHTASWPVARTEALVNETVAVAIQVNGKHRGTITLPRDTSERDAYEAALKDANVQKFAGEHEPKKLIFVPNRILNIVL